MCLSGLVSNVPKFVLFLTCKIKQVCNRSSSIRVSEPTNRRYSLDSLKNARHTHLSVCTSIRVFEHSNTVHINVVPHLHLRHIECSGCVCAIHGKSVLFDFLCEYK